MKDILTSYIIEKMTEIARLVMREEYASLIPKPEELLTREETMDFLKITPPTLNDWTKKGIIVSYGWSGTTRVYYKKSELLDITPRKIG